MFELIGWNVFERKLPGTTKERILGKKEKEKLRTVEKQLIPRQMAVPGAHEKQ